MKKIIGLIAIIFLVSCKNQNNNESNDKINPPLTSDTLSNNKENIQNENQDLFRGEPKILDQNFLKNEIQEDNIYEDLLKSHNAIFSKKSSNSIIAEKNISTDIKIILKRKKFDEKYKEKDIQILLYTKVNEKIKDSIIFYKYTFNKDNMDGDERFSTLSYINENFEILNLDIYSGTEEFFVEIQKFKKLKIDLKTGKIKFITDIQNNTNETSISEKKEISNTNEINFEKYKTEVVDLSTTSKIELNLNSNKSAKFFKSKLIEAYKSDKIDFAGHYITSIFGCGADCIVGYIIDINDGKIYNLPLGEDFGCPISTEKAIYNPNSKLFITAICKDESTKKKYYIASVWDEQQKKFLDIKEKDFLNKK